MIQSEQSAPLVASAIEQNKLRLRLRLRTALPIQKGPARIFTISADPYFRNLTVGQEGRDLVVRLRTPQTTVNGLPPYVLTEVFKSKGWQEIELLIEDSEFNLTLDGRKVASDSLPQGPLRSWDPGFRAALGNELTWDRPWLGEIAVAVIGVGIEDVDLLRTDVMELPSGFWSGNDWRLIHPRSLFSFDHSTTDLVLNFLCFIPVGFLLVIVLSRPRSVAFAMGVVAVGSLLVESAQLCFAGRHPSAIDWIVNVAGSGLGAWLAYSRKQRPVASELRAKRD
ncbi:MAG: VanZ family protein [Thermoanaerobaculia bacterium]